MKRSIFFLGLSALTISCTDQGTSPADRHFNIRFKYGVTARNELNTFENKFTKDLILDGTVTIPFVLSDNDLAAIEGKLTEIDFFTYPDTFIVQTTDTVGYISHHSTFIFKVKSESIIKTLVWADAIVAPLGDERPSKLREAIAFIRSIIESKPEYQRLPAARGGYF